MRGGWQSSAPHHVEPAVVEAVTDSPGVGDATTVRAVCAEDRNLPEIPVLHAATQLIAACPDADCCARPSREK